jgi:hypothetical protein
MKVYVTATFDAGEIRRLERSMPVVHEDWRKTHEVYFSGKELAARLREVGADVLVVEANLVHGDVIDGCVLRLIGAARGAPWSSHLIFLALVVLEPALVLAIGTAIALRRRWRGETG